MGQSFESVRMGVKEVSARWLKASRALKKEDQVYGQKLAEMARKHSSEGILRIRRPSGAAIFSALVVMLRETERLTAKMVRIRSNLRPPYHLAGGVRSIKSLYPATNRRAYN